MSMLVFMPWCPIDKSYDVGETTILRFGRDAPIDGLDETARCRANAIMAIYKNIQGKPVHRAAIVRYGAKSPTDELSDYEINVMQDLVSLGCFSALAKRGYSDSLHPYCNSDCFLLRIQKFDDAEWTALISRRREGRTSDMVPMSEISITVPTHCHALDEISLDPSFLKALIDYRAEAGSSDWGRWQSSISCFNQANSDSDNVLYQVEWVLLCSAFQHLLSANSKAADVACKFAETFTPCKELLAKNASRLSSQQKNNEKSVRYIWMREFCRIRGDFAHGKLNTQQPATWNPFEHLVLATIAFPFVVKSLLRQASMYDLTDADLAQIDCFEKLADTVDFLKLPAKWKGSGDSHWQRLVHKRQSEISAGRAGEEAWDSLSPDQQDLLGGDSSERD